MNAHQRVGSAEGFKDQVGRTTTHSEDARQPRPQGTRHCQHCPTDSCTSGVGGGQRAEAMQEMAAGQGEARKVPGQEEQGNRDHKTGRGQAVRRFTAGLCLENKCSPGCPKDAGKEGK